MIVSVGDPRLTLTPGTHVCFVVDDGTDYRAVAAAVLDDGAARGEKLFAFGPESAADLAALSARGAIAVDPRTAFLDGGPLDPDRMFAMFRDQAARARTEGYAGLRVVADMDWLLPAEPATADIVAYEALLDRVVAELDATVVCAYRTASFDAGVISATRCVHPAELGADDEPQFRFLAAADDSWRLSGEVDLAVATAFTAAMRAVNASGYCSVDIGDLQFVDVAGMRAIAEASRQESSTVVFRRASATLRHCWRVGRFDELAPLVEFADA